MRKIIALCFFFNFYFSFFTANAQLGVNKNEFTHADSLRGGYGPGHDWWDVSKYDIHTDFNINEKTIKGYNVIEFKILKAGVEMQIDLQDPLILDGYSFGFGQPAPLTQKMGTVFRKDGDAYFIKVPSTHSKPNIKARNYITLFYHGTPRVAVRAPWDGGLIWKKDKNRNPWVSIACQGLGASVWYPCKDHQSDEPDSAEMHITCPDTLVCVGNGRFRGRIDNKDGTATFDWAVVNPINNYCLIPYIGKYVNFNEIYKGEKGNLDMNYWVLEYNLEKAKEHFKDAPRMMEAFEHWFGPYPFYEDGYQLVDAPHLGMEHQSATAYGNEYKMGYLGRDGSGTGWGLKWDFIIVHESGHEWFANNITTKDIADMWVHEGFTNYSETLFIDYFYGNQAGDDYVIGTRKGIFNKTPIVGPYGVNHEGSGDMYNKGGNMLHTIRHLIGDDSLFRDILRGLNKTFYHQTVTSKQVEDYITQRSKLDLSKVFDQYLRNTAIPKLQYKIEGSTLTYQWVNCIPGFNMPVKVLVGKDKYQMIYPSDNGPESIKIDLAEPNDFKVERNFYVLTEKIN